MKNLAALALFGGLLTACNNPQTALSDRIRLNQVGYYPTQEKVAVVNEGEVKYFSVIDAQNGKELLSGTPIYTAKQPWSDKQRTILDFSSISQPGRYLLKIDNEQYPFEVKEHALSKLADASLKAFYYQRSGMPIEEQYAGKWNRPMGHPDTHVLIHPSAAGPTTKADDVISSPKGWYDAGDYNKYIVNSAYTIGLMNAAYMLYPDYFIDWKINIPEQGNGTPDYLDEIYYNLSWMLTMQDPADGGVYHKLTEPGFEAFIKPTDCHKPRYVVQKSVTATLDFAAVMAQSSLMFNAFNKDYPDFGAKAIAAAERAYEWAEQHPEAYYQQEKMNEQYDPDVTTGTYGDNNATDEFYWAACELYHATGKSKYKSRIEALTPQKFTLPTWGNVYGLGVFSWLNVSHDGDSQAYEEQLRNLLLAYADQAVAGAAQSAFFSPYGNNEKDYHWGCLAEGCAGQGFALAYAYELTRNQEYLKNAWRDMDYILGRNATGYCYVTGFGQKSPMNPHHRLSASDGIADPIPGLLVGGPNPGQQDGVKDYPSNLPDESYADITEAYAANEIAINWNAALVALAAALDAQSTK